MTHMKSIKKEEVAPSHELRDRSFTTTMADDNYKAYKKCFLFIFEIRRSYTKPGLRPLLGEGTLLRREIQYSFVKIP